MAQGSASRRRLVGIAVLRYLEARAYQALSTEKRVRLGTIHPTDGEGSARGADSTGTIRFDPRLWGHRRRVGHLPFTRHANVHGKASTGARQSIVAHRSRKGR